MILVLGDLDFHLDILVIDDWCKRLRNKLTANKKTIYFERQINDL